ncbi:glycosyltransferase [Paenibacillus athensensis]|uniref:Spore maturation protein n=2 Tax=Paenibacillus athensensis TaxID=1967502 RepID=A0A4Y8PX95_9BACL|nr:glycosyltransferase [Paenibacillus athensensis]
MKSAAEQAEAGRSAGQRVGMAAGRRLGRCQAVLDAAVPPPVRLREASVLFIVQGFDAIDEGIVQALQETVRQWQAATAYDMLERALALRPDLVLVLNGLHVFPPEHAAQLDELREQGIRTAVWYADDPYFTDHTADLAGHYDYVFTHEMGCLAFYRELGCAQVHYLPLAANPHVFKPLHADLSYSSDICFIGNGFPNRIELFNRLTPFLRGKKVLLAGALWERLAGYRLLESSIKLQWVPIEETVKYYNGAKIVINVHRLTYDEVFNKNSRNLPGHSVNPRTFEISACGTLQITDVRHDLYRYYTPGAEIETFVSPSELIAKISYYLAHEEERMRIALGGLRRTVEEHSYAARLTQLLDIVFG